MCLRATGGLVGAVFISLMASSASACALPGAEVTRVDGARHTLLYRTDPVAIVVGRHFSIEYLVCARPGAKLPESTRVDAHMPDHRHGMNYKPSIKPLAGGPAGAQRAEGLLFHMPGRWEFVFELHEAGRLERLTQSYQLR